MAKKRRIRRKVVERILDTPSFLPGVRGKNWIVREAPAHITPNTLNNMGEEARMEIPLGDTEWERYIRLHELLHAAISPLEQPRDVTFSNGEVASKKGILLAEEIRVDGVSRSKLGINQLPDNVDEIAKTAVTQLMPLVLNSGGTKYVDTLIETLLACWMSSPSPLRNTTTLQHARGFLGALEGEAHEWTEAQLNGAWNVIQYLEQGLDQILDDIWYTEIDGLFDTGIIPSWKSTVKLGYFITQLLDNTQLAQPHQEGKGIAMEMPDMAEPLKWVENQERNGESVMAKTMSDWNIDRKESRENDPEAFIKEREKPRHQEELTWGELEIIERSRPYRLPKTKVQRSKYTATDMGTHPKYVHRILIDGQPFARKRREAGGSVLIDDSGSMSFATEEIQAIVEAAPAVDIAAYSGAYDKGQLVIVSKNGTWMKVTDETRPTGYNNIVDIPALEWLARQDEPRIWVSDGLAIPAKGGMEQAILACAEFCRRNKINRVANVHDAREVFLGRKEIYR